MSIRDKEKQSFKIYEENLKSHIEIEKSNIETILRVSMPHQLNNIKTILWLNLAIVGLTLSIFQKLPFNFALIFLWISAIGAVILNVIALLGRRYKIYPEIDKMFAYNLPDTITSKSKMLGEILTTIKNAIDENRKIMAWIANFMHASLYLTLASLLFFLIYLGIALIQLKEVQWLKNHLHPQNHQLHQDKLVNQVREDLIQKGKLKNNPFSLIKQKQSQY